LRHPARREELKDKQQRQTRRASPSPHKATPKSPASPPAGLGSRQT
jgi:hypothetical protein